jgi:hypothetical protein
VKGGKGEGQEAGRRAGKRVDRCCCSRQLSPVPVVAE